MPFPWFLRPGSRKRPAALVLGGGGARGLAHIGVLDAIEREGRVPDQIVGTSIGAVIGAMYAQHPDTAALRARLEEFLHSSFFDSIGLLDFYRDRGKALFPLIDEWLRGIRMRLSATRTFTQEGMIPAGILHEGLAMLLDDTDMEDCSIPFACVSVELVSGATRILRHGSIRTAVAASSSIPGVIAPTQIDGVLMVDGATTSATPVREARAIGARTVVAVDVTRQPATEHSPKVGYEIMLRAGEIASMHCNRSQLEEADHILRPSVQDCHWARFDLADQLIQSGAECADRNRDILRSSFPTKSDLNE